MPELPDEKLYRHAAIEPPTEVAACEYSYAELDVTTNFSFLRGASHPDELVYTAALLGYKALAITDINSLAGVVRAHEAARKIKNFHLIVGCRLAFADGTPDLLVWVTDRAAYSRLCRLLTVGRRRAPKGECHLSLADFLEYSDGLLAAVVSPEMNTAHEAVLCTLRDALGDRLSLAISLTYGDDDETRLLRAADLSSRIRVPLVAINHVHYHDPGRRPLQDILTCVRHGCTIQEAGHRLFPNAERYLKSPEQMVRLFADKRGHKPFLKKGYDPFFTVGLDWEGEAPAEPHFSRTLRLGGSLALPNATPLQNPITRGLQIARQCTFSLGELKYEYPTEAVPPGKPPSEHLRELTYAGAADRYPQGIPKDVEETIEKELTFICGSQYESYFLTVHDLVHYARSQGILCQGRGSAANSAVCYCLGVTAVDPAKFQLLFERFASSARDEPPDIDIDFEHERREEVIQYVYQKYGRDRTAMTASLITYRGRSAVRDVGKALGLSRDALDELAGKLDWWHRGTLTPAQLRDVGIDPGDPMVLRLVTLTSQLLGFPRHLGQHVGGMVISRSPLCELVPIQNTAMEDRTVIEWDKDDLDVLKFFKVDILALGMLTMLSKGMAMINSHSKGPPLLLHTIPSEDPATYDMICDADTIGVFQIESRAQMSMLPRLRPREFYDLVIEVAIVRPGPIQGDMVHPYLQRRERQRADPNYEVEYPRQELKEVLEKTLGVPLFQEQAMRLAIVAAAFTGAESDELRRAMAAWKRSQKIDRLHDKFVGGMTGRGYDPDFAERCFKQISGFGEYGFPESHAASFALLVYASAWIKRHHPAVFAAALLNSQPMGFYAPAQIIRDAREHGVEVRPIDVNSSEWDCTLEYNVDTSTIVPAAGKRSWGVGGPVLRLGMRQIKGMREDDANRIVTARQIHGPFTSIAQCHRLARLDTGAIRRLAEADALKSIGPTRRPATWEAMTLANVSTPLFDGISSDHTATQLPIMRLGEEVLADYATTGLSLKRHPVSFARAALNQWNVVPCAKLLDERAFPHGRHVRVAGLVLVRQRPGTASGVVFVTLEDETGIANLILWANVYERYHRVVRRATLLQVDGIVQREGQVIHILAQRFFDRTSLLAGLHQPSRDFH
jgi:error-prone DNA polymerase